jgi:hypothetical protein
MLKLAHNELQTWLMRLTEAVGSIGGFTEAHATRRPRDLRRNSFLRLPVDALPELTAAVSSVNLC